MRLRGRTDANHGAIIKRLRQCGCSVMSLAQIGNGAPDLAVGFHGVNVFLEIKDGSKSPSRQRLTDAEKWWAATWAGQVATVANADEALEVVLREAGLRRGKT